VIVLAWIAWSIMLFGLLANIVQIVLLVMRRGIWAHKQITIRLVALPISLYIVIMFLIVILSL
jgi:hypothetical protein